MIRGIIFDMDGVLINSESLHRKAWLEILGGYGIKTDDEELRRFTGISCSHVPGYYTKKTGAILDKDIVGKKEEYYKIVARKELAAMPGVKELLDELKKINVSLAIASTSQHETIQFSLKKTKLEKYFDIICGGSDVKNCKPEPDIFLYAASKLGLDPSECIVIEDSIYGITGAKRAGMFTCGYTSSFDGKTLSEAGADYVFDDFNQLLLKINDLSRL